MEVLLLKVAICDDNLPLTEKINRLLSNYDPNMFETYTYYSPFKLIRQLDEENFDFFILDIEMNELSGIDLAKNIREQGILSPIVFLTNYKEYMEEVFQVQTFDYLLKPLTQDRMNQLLDKLRQHIGKSEKNFVFSINKVIHKVPTKEIVYFEKDKRQVLIHTVENTYKPYMSTNNVTEQLDVDFVQTHSSFIINCSYIKELGKNFLLINLKGEFVEIPISRSFKTSCHEKIIMSMRGRYNV